MAIIRNKPIWVCDRCKAERYSEKKPSSSSDAWGYFKIDQDAGWDHHGHPWCPRMREPLLLCGKCIETIITTINTCPGFEIEPGVHSGCDQSAGDCLVCGK
jgi:hypothetical protein